MDSTNTLVSIILITYNSSKYILETLESTKIQSYQNLELIISDDCSQDDTPQICKKWLDENKAYFVRTKLITVEKNTGIPANCNRGVKESRGEWVKVIAGDDAFTDNAISSFIEFIRDKPNQNIVQTDLLTYNNTFLEENLIYKKESSSFQKFFQLEAAHQFFLLQFNNLLYAPAVFFRRKAICKVDGFDEQFPKIEDYPMWLKLTSSGEKIYYCDVVTCKYRVHSNSVQQHKKTMSYMDHINNRLVYINKYSTLDKDIVLYYKIVELLNRYKIKNKYQKYSLLPFKKLLYIKFLIANKLSN